MIAKERLASKFNSSDHQHSDSFIQKDNKIHKIFGQNIH